MTANIRNIPFGGMESVYILFYSYLILSYSLAELKYHVSGNFGVAKVKFTFVSLNLNIVMLNLNIIMPNLNIVMSNLSFGLIEFVCTTKFVYMPTTIDRDEYAEPTWKGAINHGRKHG